MQSIVKQIMNSIAIARNISVPISSFASDDEVHVVNTIEQCEKAGLLFVESYGRLSRPLDDYLVISQLLAPLTFDHEIHAQLCRVIHSSNIQDAWQLVIIHRRNTLTFDIVELTPTIQHVFVIGLGSQLSLLALVERILQSPTSIKLISS